MPSSILSQVLPSRWSAHLATRRKRKKAASALHFALVDASRQPAFFVEWGVPDTLDGRFETLCFYAFVLLRRLRGQDDLLAQAVFDSIFAQLDLNLREMGVGDLGVSKKIKRMAKALYGRMAAYEGGLILKEAGEGSYSLREALVRNLYGTLPQAPSEQVTDAVITYMVFLDKNLAQQPLEALQDGRVELLNVDHLARAA